MNKKGILILLDDDILQELDRKRGLVPKATYVRHLLIQDLRGGLNENE